MRFEDVTEQKHRRRRRHPLEVLVDPPARHAVRPHRQKHAVHSAEVAGETKVPFVNLNELIAREYQKLGMEKVDAFYVPSPKENLHTGWDGAVVNAAGRLSDMGLGIECLITDDPARAANCARELDRLNSERRTIEGGMLDEALAAVTGLPETPGAGVSLYHESWHQGVVGILASRIKDKLHRPVIAFARATEGGIAGMLRGSGRSIPGLHLRDCLDLVSKRDPGLIVRFGGHAQAAGLTIRESDLDRFAVAFESAAGELVSPAALARTVETDGELDSAYFTLEIAQMMENQIWGQGFPQPVFCDTFEVESQRIVAGKHTKLRLVKDGRRIEAIWFNSLEALPARARTAYRLSINEYNGLKSVQINVVHAEAA